MSSAPSSLVIGVPSYNHRATIGRVLRAVEEGLAICCPSCDVHIVLADAGSIDGTVASAREAVRDGRRLTEVAYSQVPTAPVNMPYHGLPGRQRALRAVLEIARDRQARVCAMIDAGEQAPEPAWIGRLIMPILGGEFDYASSYHVRHAYDGAITKGIIAPLFRTIYGVGLRQPAAGEFACSLRLVHHYLGESFWWDEDAEAGIDIWLTAAAACGEFKLCETALGVRRSPQTETAPDLSATIAQVVGALFMDLERYVDVWQRGRARTAVTVTGDEFVPEPEAPSVNLDEMIDAFRLGYRELREVWTWILPPRSIVALRNIAEASRHEFRLADRLWAGIIYDFAIGYRLRVLPRDHLLRSLTPIYEAWMASFVSQVCGCRREDVERRLDHVCAAFELEKPYLMSRWRWPERLRS